MRFADHETPSSRGGRVCLTAPERAAHAVTVACRQAASLTWENVVRSCRRLTLPAGHTRMLAEQRVVSKPPSGPPTPSFSRLLAPQRRARQHRARAHRLRPLAWLVTVGRRGDHFRFAPAGGWGP